ncbi:hypothetical protein RIF29_14764 [Crotalaria pallida]|uniref:CBM20 domain-containing protein n=1 Tax=Crotalaria pallida TaxID=3830 RepID=A0AAN9FHQ1_CROPI
MGLFEKPRRKGNYRLLCLTHETCSVADYTTPQSVKVMKALTSSCSKAILSSSSPRVAAAVHVSDNRTEFCFKGVKKDCNFWLLKLAQNKGIYPVVHSVPSKTQVDLETVESDLESVLPQDQQTEENEQTNESEFVRVTFHLQKKCDFGEQFLIVGDDPVLGSWNPADALPMDWSDGHIWTVELDVPAGKSIQFKFILKGKAGDIIWQPGSDRVIQTWETRRRIIVCEDWENGELQKIIEEDQLAQSNEEIHVDSEMSTFAENMDNPEEGQVTIVSKISAIEDSQTHEEEEQPSAEPGLQQIIADSISSSMEKPMAMVAENIGSSEDLINWSEESADSPRNDDIIDALGHDGSTAQKNNEERTVVESNLFDFEGGAVLVPGLTPPVVANEEAGPGEAQERTTTETSNEDEGPGEVQGRTIDTSIEAFESKDQNVPELSKEQDSDDSTPQETNETIKNEPELLHNEKVNDSTPHEINAAIKNKPELLPDKYQEQSNLAAAIEDRSNSQPVDGIVLQNNIPEINATIENEPAELLHNEYEEQSNLAAAIQDGSNSQSDDGRVLLNDIQWGRETVKKFLTKLGLL